MPAAGPYQTMYATMGDPVLMKLANHDGQLARLTSDKSPTFTTPATSTVDNTVATTQYVYNRAMAMIYSTNPYYTMCGGL